MRENKPFYLNSTLPNVITPLILEKFKKSNPKLAPFLSSHTLELRRLELPYFHSFCGWITGQLVTVRVAEIFLERLLSLTGQITPDEILKLNVEQLFSIGLTKIKVYAIIELAKLFVNEPNRIEQIVANSSSSLKIIDYFSQIKGIGPWTVEMFLIFNLTRMDVFSYRDLVVRKGLQKLYNLQQVPTIRDAKNLGKDWGELATVGTLLSWAVMHE